MPLSHISDGIRPRVSPEELKVALAELVQRGRLEHRSRRTTTKPVDEYRLRKSEFPNFSKHDLNEILVGEEGEL